MDTVDRRDVADAAVEGRSAWARRITPTTFTPSCGTNVHDYAVLAFFIGGRAVVEQSGHYEVQAGDAYLIPAGEPHGIVSTRSPEVWGIGFSPACYAPTELSTLLCPFERARGGASKIVPIPGARQSLLADLCRELQRESAPGAAPAHSDLVTKSLLALILSEVSRAGALDDGTTAHTGLVGDALRFIERSCLGPLSLRDVAAALHRSPSHISTVVRRATGRSVTAWIIAGRLAEARRRLRHTDERVDIIAERIGYADVTHFIRTFRRAHGVTPAAWRSQRQRITSSAVSS